MKRLILWGLNPAFLLLVTLSCQKKELITSLSSESKEINQVKSQNNLRIWFDNGKDDYGCWMSGGNCLDEVVVTPWFGNLIIDFSNSSDQKAFASANYSSLSERIDKNLLDQVIARNLTVSMRGEITSMETGYVIFKSAGDNIQSVNPYKL